MTLLPHLTRFATCVGLVLDLYHHTATALSTARSRTCEGKREFSTDEVYRVSLTTSCCVFNQSMAVPDPLLRYCQLPRDTAEGVCQQAQHICRQK